MTAAAGAGRPRRLTGRLRRDGEHGRRLGLLRFGGSGLVGGLLERLLGDLDGRLNGGRGNGRRRSPGPEWLGNRRSRRSFGRSRCRSGCRSTAYSAERRLSATGGHGQPVADEHRQTLAVGPEGVRRRPRKVHHDARDQIRRCLKLGDAHARDGRSLDRNRPARGPGSSLRADRRRCAAGSPARSPSAEKTRLPEA